MSDPAPTAADKKSSPIAGLLLAVALLAASAGGGFAFAHFYLEPMVTVKAAPAAPSADGDKGEHAPADKHAEAGDKSEALPMGGTIVTLAPITTNLADPSEVWVRAEFALLLREPLEPEAVAGIQQDFIAYLRTARLYNLEGPSGFQFLVEELKERADLLSDHKVTRVFVKAFLLE
jgi:flagellar FliL protein